MKIFKKIVLIIATLSLSLLLFISSAVVPPYYATDHKAAPFFDLADGKIIFSEPTLQIIEIIWALLSPIAGSFLAYLITEQKKSVLTYLPMIVMYPLYILLIYYRLTGKLML